MSDLPPGQSLDQLLDAFERMVVRLVELLIVALVGVGGWVALDPQNRYSAEQRQLGARGGDKAAAISAGPVG